MKAMEVAKTRRDMHGGHVIPVGKPQGRPAGRYPCEEARPSQFPALPETCGVPAAGNVPERFHFIALASCSAIARARGGPWSPSGGGRCIPHGLLNSLPAKSKGSFSPHKEDSFWLPHRTRSRLCESLKHLNGEIHGIPNWLHRRGTWQQRVVQESLDFLGILRTMAQESWNRDKEETGCQPPEGPILCANNCGFFGSKAAMNLCSKCYRDIILAQAKASSVQAAFEKTHVSIQSELRPADRLENMTRKEAVACEQDGNGTTIASSSTVPQDQNPNRPPNRCFTCNKRVGLTGFKCRCGDVFCSLHRYSDKHNCSYDYKAAGRDAITKANPIVKASKIDKI